MSFTIANTSAIRSTLTQSGTDTSWAAIETAVNAVAIVARTTVYAVGNYVRPTIANGFLYRCTTAGTTMAVEPVFSTVAGTDTTDGTAIFFAFAAPTIATMGDRKTYFAPLYDVVINGTFTIATPSEETIVCRTFATGSAANYTSGTFCADGVTPKTGGTHFTTTLRGPNNYAEQSNWNGAWSIRGGCINLAAAIKPEGSGIMRFHSVIFYSSSNWGSQSIRWRSYATNMQLIGDCRLYDIGIDAFNIPIALSAKGFGSEYVSQYVGSVAGGTDSKMTISALSNQDGTFDFDNYGSGWVEIFNCVKGAALVVVCQNNNAQHCVPLFQNLNFKITNLSGAARDGVKYTCTDAPVNSPTATITTRGNLKTWDFRTALTYTGTTAGGGLASSVPVLKVWHGNTNIQNLRFPASTAVYRFCGYDVMQQDVSIILGSDIAQTVAVAMTAATNLTLTQAQATALTGIALAPSGATGGVITLTAARTLSQLWQYFRAWKPDNLTSADSWTFDGSALNVGAWTVVGLHNLTGGELTVSTASAAGTISGLQVVGNVTQAAPAALTNVSITGTLTYIEAANTSVTYTNSTLATVNNSGAGIVTVKRVNSTLTPGTNIVAYVPTVLVFTLNGGRIRVLNHLGVEQYNQTTDGTFELPAAATGTWSYKVAKYGSKPIESTFAINGTTIAISPAYIPDPVVVDTLANVSAYTALETTQKAYDYYSLYLATASGILQTKSVTLTPSLLDLGTYSLAPGALLITATSINTNSAAISGVNITTTGTVATFAPTYPQQISSPAGSTNWLRVTPTIGQVYLDSVNNTYSTTAATTLLPASFSSAITIFVTRRGYKKQVVTVPYAAGLLAPQSFVLIPDTNVLDVATDFTAADLTNSQLIYDAFSQYQSSAAGITDVYIPTKTPGAIAFGAKGFALAIATDMAASPVQIKSSALTSDTYYSDSSFAQGAATIANSVLIRASNLNSEIVFTPDSVTFYPTQSARDSGTTPGLTATGGVYRFLHGSTVSGVLMSGTVYVRVTVGAIVFFADLSIVSGANVLDLGVQGQLTAISAKVDQTPIKVWSEPLDGTIQARKLLVATTATLAGKATGGGTETLTFRNLSDTANVVTMTVDLNGNRSATIVP